MRILFFFLIASTLLHSQKKEWPTPFEKGNGNQTTTYEDCISFYQKLDKEFESILFTEEGETDSGKKLNLIYFSADKNFQNLDQKTVVLINNGIHPGESDGIDATMQLFRDLALSKIKPPKDIVIIAIPVYNIGGMLNQNSHSRANQNGPEIYGFRGNGRNFDLNRDFIKSDTKNSRSFQRLFQKLKPSVFIDNHVSNGADYQYIFTCINTQRERLNPVLGNFQHDMMFPELVTDMNRKKIDVTPYVNVHYGTPDKGFEQFADTPRYATGYTSLFNTLGFVVETHMLKPYKDRVKVTYEFMESVLKFTEKKYKEIQQKRSIAFSSLKPNDRYPIEWILDSSKVSELNFKGFEGKYKPSEVSGKNRLYYDRNKPFTKKIPFYGHYKPGKTIRIPQAYYIPQSQWTIIDLLKLNGIQLKELEKDSLIELEVTKIKDYQTSKNPYEGHYFHYNTKTISGKSTIKLLKGDFIVETQQKGIKYILETLEPEAVDSYFNWNFFDTYLQQKEYFSSYVFEDLAKQILDENPKLKAELEKKRQEDKKFADSGEAQLDWVYKHSKYSEKEYLRYPIFKSIN